ncbi:DTW domain-containing protein [Corallococcus praedator]|uniref:tRNA-uridine aminocarboxypropyltransferase n=1 Tax=Corallococcus praedator TaxID=2316724 RepID=A0ABX9QPN5_9BACT|nr:MULTISPECIES: tRNA-uridine aminocarboxypropyltransferase [Corallococcus]RKH35331.1 DTW domain-containing protein [Corallococcus sp. CA031C]RKI15780.1 DTW domain-containing protein [Corallococcus praedator]
MRSRTPEDLAGRCARCYLPAAWCLCAQVPVVPTRTELLVIRHNKEAEKSTNTARIAALALPRCSIVSYGAPGQPFDASVLGDGSDTWLLFPDAPEAEGPLPRRLVIIDGSWAQARRMVQRVPGLRRLPGMRLPPPSPDSRRLRRPPHPDGMSTLEAMAGALARLEGEDVAKPLLALHELMIERVLASRGRLGWVDYL